MSTAINEIEHIQAAAYLNERAKTVKPATLRLTAAVIASQHNFTNSVDIEEVKTVQARLARQGQVVACEAAGLGKGYSDHSSRVGGAQAATNIILVALMEHGRWQSSMMPARYTRHASAVQPAMAR